MHLLSVAQLRAHACRWIGLPEVTVPSAAVSDEQTAQWSADMYDRDLADENKPRYTLPTPDNGPPVDMSQVTLGPPESLLP